MNLPVTCTKSEAKR